MSTPPSDTREEAEDKLTKMIVAWGMEKVETDRLSGNHYGYLRNMTIGHARELAVELVDYVREQQSTDGNNGS